MRGCPGRSFPVCRAGPSLTQAGRGFSVPPCLGTGIESGAPSGLDGGSGLRTAPRRAPPFRRVLDPYACGSKRWTEKAREMCAAVRELLPGLPRGAVVDSGGTGIFRAAALLRSSVNPGFLPGSPTIFNPRRDEETPSRRTSDRGERPPRFEPGSARYGETSGEYSTRRGFRRARGLVHIYSTQMAPEPSVRLPRPACSSRHLLFRTCSNTTRRAFSAVFD